MRESSHHQDLPSRGIFKGSYRTCCACRRAVVPRAAVGRLARYAAARRTVHPDPERKAGSDCQRRE